MRINVAALPATASLERCADLLHADHPAGPQRLYPVVDDQGRLAGVVTRADLRRVARPDGGGTTSDLRSVVRSPPTVVYPDEPLRVVVHRMALTGLTRFPVVERGEGRRLAGMISLEDLLKARTVNLEAESRRETIRRVRVAFPFGLGAPQSPA